MDTQEKGRVERGMKREREREKVVRESTCHTTHVGVSGAECCYRVLGMNLSMKLSHEWTHLAWTEREREKIN